MTICAFTSVCEPDARWINQYLAECERLNMPFVVNLDRCSRDTRFRFYNHPHCVGATTQPDPAIEFDETHKQGAFDKVDSGGYKWAMAWDVDETYEREAPAKLEQIDRMDVDYVDVNWVNLWGDEKHVRVDGPFSCGHRVKFYNLDRRTWKFLSPITNGPTAVDKYGNKVLGYPGKHPTCRYNLVCLHWGMMTLELRVEHKERWDRIYSTALRGDKNPYGFWSYALDETTYPPMIQEHQYL